MHIDTKCIHAGGYKDNQIGISDNLLRLSVGIENQDDLIEDIQQALEIDK